MALHPRGTEDSEGSPHDIDHCAPWVGAVGAFPRDDNGTHFTGAHRLPTEVGAALSLLRESLERRGYPLGVVVVASRHTMGKSPGRRIERTERSTSSAGQYR